jgi:outer membrane protein TolC/DNA-binding XRE family transcriptional regulator
MIGANIRKFREKKAISQDKLSKMSDLSLNTIVKIEAGRNPNPTIKTLSRIASSLSVKVDDLLVLILCFLFFFGGARSFVYCQEPNISAPITLSLEDAIQTAYKTNKDIQVQEQEVLAARAGIMDARSEFLPQLDINAGYKRNEAVAPASAQGKKAPGVFTGYKNDNSLGAAISQIIYNGGANIANFNSAKLNARAQEETLRAQKLDVEFEAKRLYYGLLLAYETQRIAQELVDNARDHYKDVRDRYDQGASSKFDLLQSEVQVALMVPQLVKAKNAVLLIIAELKKLLSLSQETEIQLRDQKLDYVLIDIKEKEFLKTAYLNKPEMALKALGIDINKWGIAMAKAGWRPQVNASLGLDYRSDNIGDMFNNAHSLWNAGFSLTFPLFDGFSTKAKVDAAKARYKQAVLTKENVADQIAVDVKQACLDLKQAQTIIDSQKDSVFKAQEALRIAIVSYDNGEAKNLDVLDAQVSLGQVQQNLSEGIYDYLMARAELDRTLGKSYLNPQEIKK